MRTRPLLGVVRDDALLGAMVMRFSLWNLAAVDTQQGTTRHPGPMRRTQLPCISSDSC